MSCQKVNFCLQCDRHFFLARRTRFTFTYEGCWIWESWFVCICGCRNILVRISFPAFFMSSSAGAYWYEGLKWLSAVKCRDPEPAQILWKSCYCEHLREHSRVQELYLCSIRHELTERKRNRICERKERITMRYNLEKRGVWLRDRHEWETVRLREWNDWRLM